MCRADVRIMTDDSHAECFGTFRETANSMAMVCSAAEIEFAVGALAAMMPFAVAAVMSSLSSPTPARPIMRKRGGSSDDVSRYLRSRSNHDCISARNLRFEAFG